MKSKSRRSQSAAPEQSTAVAPPRRRWPIVVIPALLLIGAVTVFWFFRGNRAADTPPDIVLITIDTLRADALGFSGNRDVETPYLDSLAKKSVVFTNARAHNVVTLPSHANILTGLLPFQHGIRDNAGF